MNLQKGLTKQTPNKYIQNGFLFYYERKKNISATIIDFFELKANTFIVEIIS